MLKQNNIAYYDYQNYYNNISSIADIFNNRCSSLAMSEYLNSFIFNINNLHHNTYAITIPIRSAINTISGLAVCTIFTDIKQTIVLRESIIDLGAINDISFINFDFIPINVKKTKNVYCKIVLYTSAPMISIYCQHFSFKDKIYKKIFKNYKYSVYYIASVKV